MKYDQTWTNKMLREARKQCYDREVGHIIEYLKERKKINIDYGDSCQSIVCLSD